MASVLRIITPGEISVLVDWPLSQGEGHKLSQAPWPEDDVTPLRPLYTFVWSTVTLIKVRTADPAWLLYNISVYKNRPWKNKKGDQFLERLVSSCHSLSQPLAEFPSGARRPAKLTNFAWASKSGQGRPQCLLFHGRTEGRLWPT